MLELTFLGWQGWLVGSATGRVLVDPLLGDAVGRGPARSQQRFLFWPPRVLELSPETCPPIDALLISHEHEDHFNIPSLMRVDRAVPVILSARSSRAARSLLAEMGFTVRLAYPGDPVTIGDLSLDLWTPDHRDPSSYGDEWDTLAYLFSSASGREAFFSNVDVVTTSAMAEALSARDGVVAVYEAMSLGLREAFARHATKLSEMHRPPSELGFALDPDGGDARALLEAKQRFRPVPGQTFVLADGAVAEVRPRAPFLSTPPPATWPQQQSFWRGGGDPLATFTEPRDLGDDEIEELEQVLARFAEFLYGRELHGTLYSQSQADLGARKPTFLWVLCMSSEEDVLAYEYQPEACAFVPLDELGDPLASHAGVVISWAGDLLALGRGEFEPRCIAKGISETWLPSCRGANLTQSLWTFFHPLRHPERVLGRYRAALAEQPPTPPVFRRR